MIMMRKIRYSILLLLWAGALLSCPGLYAAELKPEILWLSAPTAGAGALSSHPSNRNTGACCGTLACGRVEKALSRYFVTRVLLGSGASELVPCYLSSSK